MNAWGLDESLLDRLRMLARVIALEPELRFELHRGGGWYLDPAERVIVADPGVLPPELPPAQLVALTAHEAGHCYLSHYDLYEAREPFDEASRDEALRLLNALEDCRLERHLVARFPGLESWLWEVNAYALSRPRPPILPPLHELGLELCRRSAGSPAFPLSEAVQAILPRLEPAVHDYVACQPPAFVVADEATADVAADYARLSLAEIFYEPADSPVEQARRLASYAAWRIFADRFWPIAQDLLPNPAAEDEEGGEPAHAEGRRLTETEPLLGGRAGDRFRRGAEAGRARSGRRPAGDARGVRRTAAQRRRTPQPAPRRRAVRRRGQSVRARRPAVRQARRRIAGGGVGRGPGAVRGRAVRGRG